MTFNHWHFGEGFGVYIPQLVIDVKMGVPQEDIMVKLISTDTTVNLVGTTATPTVKLFMDDVTPVVKMVGKTLENIIVRLVET